MRVTKAILGVGLLIGLALMWTNRDFVIDSYASGGETQTDLRLDGIDLDFQLTPIEDSPYEVLDATDTRRVPIVLAFDDDIIIPESPQPTVPDNGVGESIDGEATVPSTIKPAVTLPPPPIHGGTAELKGTVIGPEGPVPFATIRLERHTSEGLAVKDITAGARGQWSAGRLLGGRYRVRAWSKGLLTMTESQVFFLADEEINTVELVLDEVRYEPHMSLVDAGNIYLGLTGSIAVSVTYQTVDEDGLIIVSGLPGAIVTIYPSHGITATPTVAVADTDGVARFTLRCHDLGSKTALVQHQEDVQSFALPSCVPIPPPPPPPTTAPAPVETTPDGLPVVTVPPATAPPTTAPTTLATPPANGGGNG